MKFTNGEYYHVYNRGVDKRDIFLEEQDYLRFLISLREFNCLEPIGSLYEKEYRDRIRLESQKNLSSQLGTKILGESESELVKFVCYSLIPNHYHFILRQIADDGISKFMHKLSLGYTNYFNKKNQRSGSLFQGSFKAVEILTNEDLFWVAAYVNGNAQIHGLVEDASKYKWCSYSEYLGALGTKFPIGNLVPKASVSCEAKDIILSQFKNISEFQKVTEECFINMKERKEMQKYLID